MVCNHSDTLETETYEKSHGVRDEDKECGNREYYLTVFLYNPYIADAAGRKTDCLPFLQMSLIKDTQAKFVML